MGMRPSSGDGNSPNGEEMVADILGPTTYTVIHSVYLSLADITAVAARIGDFNSIVANLSAIQSAAASLTTIAADTIICQNAVTACNLAAVNAANDAATAVAAATNAAASAANTSATAAHASEISASNSAAAAATAASQAQAIAGGNFEAAIAGGTVSQYWRGDKTWQTLNKGVVGLANVDNTADATKSVLSATKFVTARTINGVAFDGTANIIINAVDATARIAVAEKGVANGVATLDGGGKVPASQLPSYVDDILEYANLAAFPAVGESGKIYITLDTNWEYRWSGSGYTRIVASPGTTDALVEGTSNLYFSDARAISAIINKTLTGTFGITGQMNVGALLVGTNGGGSTAAYVNGAAGSVRTVGFLTNGSYAADISLLSDNVTVKYNAQTAHSFQIQGADQLRIELNKGITVTCFDSTYGVGVKQSRAGQVGYHMYNNGSVVEWLTYQPAHASGDEYRIATFVGGTKTDRLLIDPSGNVTVPGRMFSNDIYINRGDGTGALYFGAFGSDKVIYWDGTAYQMPSGHIYAGGKRVARALNRPSADMTISTAAPSGGNDGDIWYQV